MKAVIRFEVSGDQDNQLSLRLRTTLAEAGFVINPQVRSSFENAAIDTRPLAQAMLAFWQQAMNSTNNAHVEHLSLFCVQPADFQ